MVSSNLWNRLRPEAGPRPPRATGLLVLLIEGDGKAAEWLAELLRLDGHRVHVLPPRPAALRLAEERPPPDAVLLGTGWLAEGGPEAVTRLRDRPAPKQPLLIALPGSADEADRRCVGEAGIDLHLSGPSHPGLLRWLLRRFQRILLPTLPFSDVQSDG